MVRGFNQCISIGQFNIRGFGRILSGKDSAKESLAGPLAIAQMAGDIADRNIWDLLHFMAYLSVVLAFINILPIPALDGGHLIIILIEGIVANRCRSKQNHGSTGRDGILLTFIVFVFTTTSHAGSPVNLRRNTCRETVKSIIRESFGIIRVFAY